MEREAAYSAQQLTLFTALESAQENPVSSSGKTYQEHSAATRELILEPCLRKSDRPKFQYLRMENGQTQEWQNCLSVKLRGASSTLNIGASPNVAIESFLSRILQPMTDVPEKYYLSAKACLGILRRAKERGKDLPEDLRIALERQAHRHTPLIPLQATP